MTNKTIIGINAEVEETATGVPANFHVIANLNIGYNYDTTHATIDGFFSRKHKEQGKQSLGSFSVTLNGTPPKGACALDWAYRQLVAPIADGAVDAFGAPILPNAFTGAELVTG